MEQSDLAALANVSVDTVKRLERTVGPISANINTVNAIVATLELAGIDFTNGGQPGVRPKLSEVLITQADFVGAYEHFERERMHLCHPKLQLERYGLTFLALTLHGQRIGTASQGSGGAYFLPATDDRGRILIEGAKLVFETWARRALQGVGVR